MSGEGWQPAVPADPSAADEAVEPAASDDQPERRPAPGETGLRGFATGKGWTAGSGVRLAMLTEQSFAAAVEQLATTGRLVLGEHI